MSKTNKKVRGEHVADQDPPFCFIQNEVEPAESIDENSSKSVAILQVRFECNDKEC